MAPPADELAHRRWVPLALALAATAVVFAPLLFAGELLSARDMQRVYPPLWEYWRDRVLGGELPQWFPFDGLGQPFISMVVGGAFHPAHLLTLVVPAPSAVTLAALGSYPVATLGAHALARRLGASAAGAALAGVTYAFSGVLLGLSANLPYLMAAATAPWALWALDRFTRAPSVRGAALAAGLLALLVLGGDPQSWVLTAAAGVLLAALRASEGERLHTSVTAARPEPVERPSTPLGLTGVGSVLWGPVMRAVARATGVGALSALLAAAQLGPSLLYGPEALLSTQTAAQALAWSTHPLRLLELALGPLFAGAPGSVEQAVLARRLLSTSRGQLWVDSLLVGVPSLALAALGLWAHRRSRQARWAVGAAVALALLALGKWGGLYHLLFVALPPWRMFRYPEKLWPLVVLALALAAGAGLDAAEVEGRRRKLAALLAGGAALALGLAGVELWAHLWSRLLLHALGPGVAQARAAALSGQQWVLGAAAAAVAALGCAALLALGRRPGPRRWLLVTWAFAALAFGSRGLVHHARPELLEATPALVAAIREREPEPPLGRWRVFRLPGGVLEPARDDLTPDEVRAVGMSAALEPVTSVHFGLEHAGAQLPATTARVVSLWDEQKTWFQRDAPRLGTRYFALSQAMEKPEVLDGKRVLARQAELGLVLAEDERALPRAYLARPRCVADAAAARAALGSLGPGEALVEGCQLAAPQGAPPELGAARVTRYQPERVELEVSARAAAALVLNDAFTTGWSASADGAPVPILPANVAVRAVLLGPGEHRVVMQFQTPGLRAGLWSSGLAWALLSLACLREWRRSWRGRLQRGAAPPTP